VGNQRNALPAGSNGTRQQIDSGTLARTASSPPVLLDGNLQTWRAGQRGSPYIAPTEYQLASEFYRRIELATTHNDLARIAADVGEVRRHYEQQGLIRKPPGGDDDVKKLIKEEVGGQLKFLWSLLFSAAWEAADKDIEDGVREAAKKALWDVCKQIIEDRYGAFVLAVVKACKSRDLKGLLKASEEAVKGLAQSFSEPDGIMREVLKRMGKSGVLDKTQQYAVRRFLERHLTSFAKSVSSLAKLTASPFVFIRITLTPSTTVDDAGERYYLFKGLGERISAKAQELYGRRDPNGLNAGPALSQKPAPTPVPAAGPVLRQP
jgi:hypothetical protein